MRVIRAFFNICNMWAVTHNYSLTLDHSYYFLKDYYFLRIIILFVVILYFLAVWSLSSFSSQSLSHFPKSQNVQSPTQIAKKRQGIKGDSNFLHSTKKVTRWPDSTLRDWRQLYRLANSNYEKSCIFWLLVSWCWEFWLSTFRGDEYRWMIAHFTLAWLSMLIKSIDRE